LKQGVIDVGRKAGKERFVKVLYVYPVYSNGCENPLTFLLRPSAYEETSRKYIEAAFELQKLRTLFAFRVREELARLWRGIGGILLLKKMGVWSNEEG